jgi:hypothetical protein
MYIVTVFPASINCFQQSRAAQERMEEMRQVIGRRQGEYTPRSRPRSTIDINRTPTIDKSQVDRAAQVVDDLVLEADNGLVQAVSHQDKMQEGLRKLIADYREVSCTLTSN